MINKQLKTSTFRFKWSEAPLLYLLYNAIVIFCFYWNYQDIFNIHDVPNIIYWGLFGNAFFLYFLVYLRNPGYLPLELKKESDSYAHDQATARQFISSPNIMKNQYLAQVDEVPTAQLETNQQQNMEDQSQLQCELSMDQNQTNISAVNFSKMQNQEESRIEDLLNQSVANNNILPEILEEDANHDNREEVKYEPPKQKKVFQKRLFGNLLKLGQKRHHKKTTRNQSINRSNISFSKSYITDTNLSKIEDNSRIQNINESHLGKQIKNIEQQQNPNNSENEHLKKCTELINNANPNNIDTLKINIENESKFKQTQGQEFQSISTKQATTDFKTFTTINNDRATDSKNSPQITTDTFSLQKSEKNTQMLDLSNIQEQHLNNQQFTISLKQVEKQNDKSIIIEQRFCTSCNIDQIIRSKHCKYCDRCVALYDHHCSWMGNCIGQNNRCFFYLYLICQSLIALGSLCILGYSLYLSLFENEKNLLDDILGLSLYLASLGILIFFCFFIFVLLSFHTMLALRNNTTWEYLSWQKITYLQDWPEKYGSPFSRGMLWNIKFYITSAFTNYLYEWKVPSLPKIYRQQK